LLLTLGVPSVAFDNQLRRGVHEEISEKVCVSHPYSALRRPMSMCSGCQISQSSIALCSAIASRKRCGDGERSPDIRQL
jgi:hypothetical protein